MDAAAEASTAAIVRLTHDYAFLNDTFQVDELAALFSADGCFDMRPAGLGRYLGREAIRGFFAAEKEALNSLFHLTANHRIDVAGAQAVGTVYFMAVARTRPDGRENPIRGYYEDVYGREADGWRFRSRITHPLIPWSPHPQKASP